VNGAKSNTGIEKSTIATLEVVPVVAKSGKNAEREGGGVGV